MVDIGAVDMVMTAEDVADAGGKVVCSVVIAGVDFVVVVFLVVFLVVVVLVAVVVVVVGIVDVFGLGVILAV